MIHGKTRENLPVKSDIFDLENIDKTRVGEAERTEGSIKSNGPKAAEIILFIAPMGKGVLAGFKERRARLALFLRAAKAEALGFF